MSAEWITQYKKDNRHLLVNTQNLRKRSNIPRSNCIEESEMRDVLQGYKKFKSNAEPCTIQKLEKDDSVKSHLESYHSSDSSQER